MIKIENIDVYGWRSAIRGMRNPMNSWQKSDTEWVDDEHDIILGENDLQLMQRLAKAGTDHRKYLRMITVYLDITAPLYFWKEMDTYKVGTVRNSCSTMHKIADKEFTVEDFSCERLSFASKKNLVSTIELLNYYRDGYNKNKSIDDWWNMIQLLPNSYNQKATVMLNYEVLANIHRSRKNHKLNEWREFCKWVETLPYFCEICGDK